MPENNIPNQPNILQPEGDAPKLNVTPAATPAKDLNVEGQSGSEDESLDFPEKPGGLLEQALRHLAFCTTKGVILDQSIIDDLLAHKDLVKSADGPIKSTFYSTVGRLESVYSQVVTSIACTEGWDLTRRLSWGEKLFWSRIFQSYSSMAQTIFFSIALAGVVCLAYFETQYFLGSSLLKNCNSADSVLHQLIPDISKEKAAELAASVPIMSTPAATNLGTDPHPKPPGDMDKNKKIDEEADRQILYQKEQDAYSDERGCLASLSNWNNFTIGSFDLVLSLVRVPDEYHLKQMLNPEASVSANNTLNGVIDKGAINHVCTIALLLVSFINSVLCASLSGVLGSSVYILRIISVRANKHDLWDDCIGTYMTRLLLGGICGAVIGYLPANAIGSGDITTISPIALSFIAGYNIELVFTALDKLMQAFATSSPNATKENPPRG